MALTEAMATTIAAIIGAGSAAGSIGATASQNKKTRELTRELNAKNRAYSVEDRDIGLDFAREDRQYNNERSQYARLLSLGLSPAAAQAAVSGASSNLAGPASMGTSRDVGYEQQPYNMSGFANVGTTIAQAGQNRFEEERAEREFMHQKDIQDAQFKHEKSMKAQEIVDGFPQKERAEQEPKANEVWQKIRTAFRDANVPFEGKSRAQIEDWLKINDNGLLEELNEVVQNPCANAFIDKYAIDNNMQISMSEDVRNKKLQNSLLGIEKNMRNIDWKKAEEDLKYYPEMMRLMRDLKNRELRISDLTIDKMKQDYDISAAKEEFEEFLRREEKRRIYKRTGRADYGDPVSNAIINTWYGLFDNLGMTLESGASGLIRLFK